MFSVSRVLCVSAAVALSAGAGYAQDVLSAKSGLVHYIEGDVAVAGKPVADKPGVFAEVKKDENLETGLGRAEVLLTPGVFLRVGEQSSIRMDNASLSDTRVEILSGRAMVESDTPMKGNAVTILYKDYSTAFLKHGLYEFQTSPAQVKVYSGEVQVTAAGQTVTVHEGHTLMFTAALAQERFDSKDGDSLYRWSKTRSEYVSIANVSAARYSQGGSSYGSGFLGNGFGNWAFNNSYGMYTYLPFNGTAYSPFGFAYFSPYTVYQAYPYYSNYGGVTGGGSGNTSANHGSATGANQVRHSQIVAMRNPGPGAVHGAVYSGRSGGGVSGSSGYSTSSVTTAGPVSAPVSHASSGRGK